MIKIKSERRLAVLGFGEVMLRLSPPGKERISFSESFEKNAGGSELNVVSGISMLGMPSGIITSLPKSEIGKFIRQKIRYFGANTDYVISDQSPDARLGIYYYENGANPRPSMVLYDRMGSSFSRLTKENLPFDMYSQAKIFHTSGITLGLGENIRKATMEIIKSFTKHNTLISFDVNYREALWTEEEAREKIKEFLPLVNILFVSEETSRRMFKMNGTLMEIHKEYANLYPNLEIIASTKRKVTSQSKHSFSSLIYDCKADEFYMEKAYEDIDVVDRVGSGDAYVAGVLYGLLKYGNIEKAAQFGDAMATIKSTVSGDISKCDSGDVERIIKRHLNTTQNNEMVR